MSRTGLSDLPLHGGEAPRWLFTRMVSLAEAISEVVIDEYGTEELLRRMADPFWFQAYSCVLGFDWHSSGTTTVTCGAMKEAMKRCPDIGVAGGKGSVSRKAPAEIEAWCAERNLSDSRTARLTHASRLSAKVDSAAPQDGHALYHHCILFDSEGNWSVVQQGMNESSGYARRYQWSSAEVSSFVEEPHTGILGTRSVDVLDMTARSSSTSRAVSLDLVRDGVEHLRHDILVVEKGQSTIDDFSGLRPKKLHMPRNVNWEVLSRAYEVQPTGHEELLGISGIGPSTVRALALIGELIYGTEPSWKDPVKYSFTVGGKDGVPYPVDRRAMDRSIQLLRAGIEESRRRQGEASGDPKAEMLRPSRYRVITIDRLIVPSSQGSIALSIGTQPSTWRSGPKSGACNLDICRMKNDVSEGRGTHATCMAVKPFGANRNCEAEARRQIQL